MTTATKIPVNGWPDIDKVPRAYFRAALCQGLARRAVRGLAMRMEYGLAGGTADTAPVLRVNRSKDFFRRLGAGGLIGFGESYMAGDWEADDLPAVLTALATRLDTFVPRSVQRLRGVLPPRLPDTDRGTIEGAKRNIHRHYDLSNSMFAAFLDETMTYSSALFPEGPTGVPEATVQNLAAAQRRKIDRLLDQARVSSGTRLLEIGTGWGELAIRAARRGAAVTSITISDEQLTLARGRVDSHGLSELVDIRLCDYREITGAYDAIVSVEMIEAVGPDYWAEYFHVLAERLVPGGLIALQAITMPHHRLLAMMNTRTWISKYIFPGGRIPSPTAIEENLGRLRITDRFSMRSHYAETLRLWRERYLHEVETIGALGFDEIFHRMWTFYLAYCEAGFRSDQLDVWQLTLAHKD